MDARMPYMDLMRRQAELKGRASVHETNMRVFSSLENALIDVIRYKKASLKPSEMETLEALRQWCGDMWVIENDARYPLRSELLVVERSMRELKGDF